MLRSTLGMMRELPRLHEITSVLIRHGLGDFVQRIGIAGVLESAGRMLHWGDAGEEFSFKSWLVNFGSTSPDLVTHQCSTYNDMESDTSATTLQGEQLSMRHWTGSGFGPSTTEVTPALKSRFAEGPEACLKGK